MPTLTCGGMRFLHYHQDPKDKSLETLIRRGLELGIDHIETARGYGTSEEQLGEVLPLLPRDEVLVQTKVGPKASPREFRKTVELSLKTLKLDYLDLLTLHGINNREILEWCLKPRGCLSEILKMQKEGLCRFVGFSTHANLPIILEMIDTGAMQYVNIHWYYVQQVNWPAILAATRQDMGVFIISPNDKGGKLYAPSEKLKRLCKPLTPMQFNDLWCLVPDEIHTLSIGASCAEDFDEHIEGFRRYEERASMTAPIAKRIEAEMRTVLGDDWFDRWHVGLPDHREVPGLVNVREILRLWNFAKSRDMSEYGKMRYNLLGNGGHWFPGTTAGTFNEKKLSTSIRNSPFADRIPGVLREAHAMMAEQPLQRLTGGD